ncbi:Protein of unknown function [Meinhardsimonia xiamenensis]|jgi:hypothetical protein|uniref:Beta-barrel assembly machine subunit BamF n=1 Tax=Meinhardsimonia xiamenensis TaxID=990712 RepID=A0A1G9E584_9RHOB|nr:DUF3035 domain-containing protein [Meinhardsimonia xiamenensis]PRX33921.1 beta-barrel assembly complex subunit BamF [Meinhardsimonia xiamenensis]SDK71262.1 Protein of unknown function [Meinhardsimonia xiamenensis]
MTRGTARLLPALLVVAVLSACASDEPKLLNLKKTGAGPDEFAVVPYKPLQQPQDYASLPEPTPGAGNLVDPTPKADAIAALGGRPTVARGVPAADAGLVSHASRYGVDGAIRTRLAAEDLEWRRRKSPRLLERLFSVTTYYRAYRRMALDQHAELERFRAAGVWTPAAPPERK